MEKQVSMIDLAHDGVKRQTRKEKFLSNMEDLIPFEQWEAMIEPYYYPKNVKGGRGRPPMGIKKMLRMYLLQVWFTLSDEALEDAIYEIYSFQKFVGIDLMSEKVPDAVTLLQFRHLLEANGLQQKMMAEQAKFLKDSGVTMTKGTIVDATIIHASGSTKNQEKKRDSEAKSTKKGGNWFFGFKAHIGTDTNGIVHSVVTTSGNVADVTVSEQLLHGDEKAVYGDSGFIGMKNHLSTKKKLKCYIVQKKSIIDKIENEERRAKAKEYETKKCKIRAKVEHVFHVIKNIFGYKRAKYKGIAKNDGRLNILFALANIYRLHCQGRSPQLTMQRT